MVIPFGRIRHCVAIAVLVMMGQACADEDRVARRGSIMVRDDVVLLEMPAEFRVNEPDTVTITTLGNSCVSFARTEVSVHGLSATVEPYDFDEMLRSSPNEIIVCNDNTVEVAHPAELVFHQIGEVTIWFIGLHHWIDSVGWHDSVTFVPRRLPVR